MSDHCFDSRREGGMGLVERLFLIAILLAFGIKVLATVASPLYDYYIMKDEAKRVVKEYADLNLGEVKRRVDFTLHQSQIQFDEDVFKITPLDKGGYKVEIDDHIPLALELGDYKVGEGKELHLTYTAEP